MENFPLRLLTRLLSTPTVRAKIGLEIEDGKLLTSLPPDEVIKALRRIVLDLAEKTVNVTKLKLKPQQLEYVSLGGADSPNLSKKSGDLTPLEGISEKRTFRQGEVNAKKKRRLGRLLASLRRVQDFCAALISPTRKLRRFTMSLEVFR